MPYCCPVSRSYGDPLFSDIKLLWGKNNLSQYLMNSSSNAGSYLRSDCMRRRKSDSHHPSAQLTENVPRLSSYSRTYSNTSIHTSGFVFDFRVNSSRRSPSFPCCNVPVEWSVNIILFCDSRVWKVCYSNDGNRKRSVSVCPWKWIECLAMLRWRRLTSPMRPRLAAFRFERGLWLSWKWQCSRCRALMNVRCMSNDSPTCAWKATIT